MTISSNACYVDGSELPQLMNIKAHVGMNVSVEIIKCNLSITCLADSELECTRPPVRATCACQQLFMIDTRYSCIIMNHRDVDDDVTVAWM